MKRLVLLEEDFLNGLTRGIDYELADGLTEFCKEEAEYLLFPENAMFSDDINAFVKTLNDHQLEELKHRIAETLDNSSDYWVSECRINICKDVVQEYYSELKTI